ncbi:MAG: hypothetical protein L0G80_19530 [Shewanella sp.]|uniref:hypothetical protein n=1 Tax=Shewanella sp. TaxID=50422 RepID=UPI002649613B|nr:hypothetical protein [Shewanella sp.]MDN5502091.1 hypothetical protein [Shewanella sp.]
MNKLSKFIERVLFDKLVIVCHCLELEHCETIVRNLFSIVAAIVSDEGVVQPQVMKSLGGYRYSVKLPLLEPIDWVRPVNGEPHLFIQVGPYAQNRPFIRFEFKGFPLNREHYYLARLWLEKIIPASAHFLLTSENMKVTTLDIALDLMVDINNICVNFASSQTSGVFFAKDGGIGTIILGNKKSGCRITAYDRTANCKAKNLPTDNEPETRIESQFKPNCKLSQLEKFINQHSYLKRIQVYDLMKLKILPTLPPHTLMAITAYGLKPALQRLPKDERRKMQSQLKKCVLLSLDDDAVKDVVMKELKKLRGLMSEHSGSKSAQAQKIRKMFRKQYGTITSKCE